MRVEVLTRQGSASQDVLDHVVPRIEHLDQYLADLEYAKVTFFEQRGRSTAEITVHSPRNIFRSEKSADDALEAFDDAMHAVEKQVRRLKGRIRRHDKTSVRKLEVDHEEAPEPEIEQVLDEPLIVRVKSQSLKPMSPQEAALQMEMVGYDFYVFTNAQSGNTAVIYRRHSEGYGLIEPRTEQ
jgi:putative sigma-54 modulation protein